MKLKLILTTAIVGAALALPSASSAASTPTQDSVTLSGGPATASNAINDFVIYDLNATSGPSGENATGHVTMDASTSDHMITYHLDGAVTCLAVNGNQASINFTDPNLSFFGVLRIQVVDGQPDTFTSFPELDNISASDCTPIVFGPGNGQVMNGDISVVDAQPSPTTKDQCKGDGWKQFGFKNQGQCIKFVNHGS